METAKISFHLLRGFMMKKHILAILIASTVLAGCSSNSSKNDTPPPESQGGVADVIYNEELHGAVINGDEGNNAVIIADGNGNAAITVNGQAFTVQGDVIVNDQGDIVGTVTTDNGTAIAYIGDTTYTLTVIDGRLIIDKANLIPEFDGDNGWGNSEHPVDKEHPELDKPPEFVVGTGNVKWEVSTNGNDFIQIDEIHGDRFVQIVKDKDGTIIIQDQDGNRIERPDAGWGFAGWNGDMGWGNLPPMYDGKYATVELIGNDDGTRSLKLVGENGREHHFDNTAVAEQPDGSIGITNHKNITVYFVEDASQPGYYAYTGPHGAEYIYNSHNGQVYFNKYPSKTKPELDKPQLNQVQIEALKNKAKALSTEQRQQIKQAIKTKLQTRS